MIDQAAPLAVHGRAHATAAIMPDHHDVLHLQHIDCELQHGQIVGVLRGRQVGDVAVHEQFAGIEADDLVGGHPAVGTADPQILRRLLAFEPPEESGDRPRSSAPPQARLFVFKCSSMDTVPGAPRATGSAHHQGGVLALAFR